MPTYFEKVLGFFTIECIHSRAVETLSCDSLPFSHTEVANLWKTVDTHINKLCLDLSFHISRPEDVIRLKEHIIVLIEVVSDDAYNFRTDVLYDTIKQLWHVFENISLVSLEQLCMATFNECRYQPFYVTTALAYQYQVEGFKLHVLNDGAGIGCSSTSMSGSSSADDMEMDGDIFAADHRQDAHPSAISLAMATAGTTRLGHDPRQMQMQMHSPLYTPMHSSHTPSTTHITNMATRDVINIANLDALEEEEAEESQLVAARAGSRPTSTSKTRPLPDVTFSPITLSFSNTVPALLLQLHLFIYRSLVYVVVMRNNSYASSSARAKDMCTTVAGAFQVVCRCFTSVLTEDKQDLPLSKAVQVAIDANTILAASKDVWVILETALRHFRWTDNLHALVSEARKESKAPLAALVSRAQGVIFDLLSRKIEELLGSLVFVNFEPTVLPLSPHESVEEIIDFLEITFMCLSNLPASIKATSLQLCCTNVANGIISHMLSPQVKSINVFCILALEMDAKRLQQFADNSDVPDLRRCFGELHDMVKVVLHPNLPQLGDNEDKRRQLFPRVSARKLAALLEKITPSSVYASSLNLPRLERSMMQQLAKKLNTNTRHGHA